MSKRSNPSIIYEDGVPLCDAPMFFASLDLKREYEDARKREAAKHDAAVRKQAEALRSVPPSETRTWLASQLGIDLERLDADPTYLKKSPGDEDFVDAVTKHSNEILQDMLRELRVDLRRGRFRVFGFQHGIPVEKGPSKIPQGALQSHIDIECERSVIIIGQMQFSAVRLSLAELSPIKTEEEKEEGRPSTKLKTIRLYKQGLVTGKFTEDDDPKDITTAITTDWGKNPPLPRTMRLHIKSYLAKTGNK